MCDANTVAFGVRGQLLSLCEFRNTHGGKKNVPHNQNEIDM